MRSLLSGLIIFLGIAGASRAAAQGWEDPRMATAPFAVFSGYVSQLDRESITVTRKGNGREPLRKIFSINGATKIEGKVHVNARVTVRYVTAEAGLIAMKIIVR